MIKRKLFPSIFIALSAPFLLTAAEVWPTPEIPKAAARISGVTKTEILLNDQSGESWNFLFKVPDWKKSGMPLPGAKVQDFDFSAWESLPWKSIKVPSEAIFQGFDILANNEYYYRRKVKIPQDWVSKRILLRFDGVYSNARVWIDGKYIRSHIGGFTTWDCDLTDRVKAGTTFTLVVGVADIFSNQRGIWNPDGKFLENPSIASKYAHHNIGGILRDVSLVVFPKSYLAHTYIETDFDPDFTDATLKVTANAKIDGSGKAEFGIELLDKDKPLSHMRAPIKSAVPSTFAMLIRKPRPWTAETPYLYLLRTTLYVNGKNVQSNEQRIGFRELHFGGRGNTDRGKLYVNGRPVHLRGTCRHDITWDKGRSTTREDSFREARGYKEANINFIRTSHYPCSEHLLDACEELGIYVEQETAVCFQGPWSSGQSSYSDFMDQFTEMVERDRNRTAIIIWSLGNESDYRAVKKRIGKSPFLGERRYLQANEPSRPVIFSWPNTGIPKDLVDIHSKHYMLVSNTPWCKTLPILHEEYAHIPCYNHSELLNDTNVRNFWGESIVRYWNRIISDPRGLGGALWGGIDDVFYIPSNTSKRWKSHSNGSAVGYGEWGSVWDVFQRFKPEAWMTKKAYTPVKLDEAKASFKKGRFSVPVENRFDHLSLSTLRMTVKTDDNFFSDGPFPSNILPRTSGRLELLGLPGNIRKLDLAFITPDGVTVESASFELNRQPRPVFVPGPCPEVIENERVLTVSGKNYTVSFDKKKAQILEARSDKEKVIEGGPCLNFGSYSFPLSWQPAAEKAFSCKKGEKTVTVTLLGTSYTVPVKFTLEFFGNNAMETRYELLARPRNAKPNAVGISFQIPTTLSGVAWHRQGLHSTYPEDHIGRNRGIAHKVRPGYLKHPDIYGIRPPWSWKDDMRNFFLYSVDDINDGLVTHDFKAMREAIFTYGLLYTKSGLALEILSDGKSQAAQVVATVRKNVIDDRSPRIRYSADGWRDFLFVGDHAGTERYSTRKGAFCELDFKGTGIHFIGSKQENTGKAKIWIDGKFVQEVDTFSNLGNALKQSVIYSTNRLPYGDHTIRVETAGGKFDCIVIDGFEIEDRTLSRNETDFLLINDQWYYPEMAWGNYLGKPTTCTKGTMGKTFIRFK